MTEIKHRTENDAAFDFAERKLQPKILEVDGNRFVVLPRGHDMHSLREIADERLEAPRQRKGTAHLDDLESFILWTKRFADEDSAIFVEGAGTGSPRMTTIVDYHEGGVPGGSAPRWCSHRGTYAFPVSDEWKAWRAASAWMSQTEFAELLEDHIVDVLDPSEAGEGATAFAASLGMSLATPSRLLTLSRGLTMKVEQRVAQVKNLSSGEAQMVFEESHHDEDGAPLKVPGGFVLAIPVFRGDGLYQIPARLRYRYAKGVVRWRVLMHRSDAVVRDAVLASCSAAEEGTGLPLFFGRSEAG